VFCVLITDSVAEPGCLSRILDPNFFHPGSWVEKIPGSRVRIRIKEFMYFNPKLFLSSRTYYPWCSSWFLSPTPDPGSRVQKGTGSGSGTLQVCVFRRCCSSTARLRSVWSAVYSVEPPAVAGTLQYSSQCLAFLFIHDLVFLTVHILSRLCISHGLYNHI
jgi:hypothetical protein